MTNRAKQPEMIAKLEWIQSNAQKNIEQLQNPTMGVTINNNKNIKSPPLQFNNNITYNKLIYLGQGKQKYEHKIDNFFSIS